MEKPISLKISDLKEGLIETINEAQLPPSIVAMVLSQIIEQVNIQSQIELEQAANEWKKVNEEALKKEEE